MDKYKTVEFTNNTFYSGTEDTGYKMRGFTFTFSTARTETGWNDKVAVFNKNLLYNITSLGLIADYQVGRFEMKDNVVSAPNASSDHSYLLLQSLNQPASAVTFSGNVYYGAKKWRGTRYMGDTSPEQTLNQDVVAIVGSTNKPGNADNNPVTVVDIATGTFTLAEGYSNVGAQR